MSRPNELPAALASDGLSIGFPARDGRPALVLRDASLNIEPGQSIGIVGESGCGKSTLAYAMLGHLRGGSVRTAGEVAVFGEDLFALSASNLQQLRGRRIALVPQNAGMALTPSMRIGAQVSEALELHRNLHGSDAELAASRLLAQVRLPSPTELFRRFPHQLSGGQQQRVAIAIALAGNPKILVLDEPTTGLDVTTQSHILALLDQIRRETGVTTVFISHDLGVIAHMCDRLVVMYAGEIVEDGDASTVFAAPSHPYTRGLLRSVPRLHDGVLPIALAGQPPPPQVKREGCAFAARCALASARCRSEEPSLITIERLAQPRQVRCFHWNQIDDSVVSNPSDAARPQSSTPAPERPLLHIEHLAVTYHRDGWGSALPPWRERTTPPPTVLDVDLTLARGETLALVGESGSGKSTIVRSIAGLQPWVGGDIRFGEDSLAKDVLRRPAELRRAIQLIFQNPDASLNPRQTVAQAIERPLHLFHRLGSAARRERALELLEHVRLSPEHLKRYPGQLSGGEKQRVAIARAFAANPAIILCDEVVSALDVSVQAAILNLLARLQAAEGTAYLFISHDLAVVRAFADRVAILYLGRLCELGPTRRVFQAPFHPYTETLLGAVLEPEPGFRPRLLASDTVDEGPPRRGCPFQRRCPHHLGSVCDTETPPWQPADDGHAIKCHIPLAELHARQQPLTTVAIERRELLTAGD